MSRKFSLRLFYIGTLIMILVGVSAIALAFVGVKVGLWYLVVPAVLGFVIQTTGHLMYPFNPPIDPNKIDNFSRRKRW